MTLSSLRASGDNREFTGIARSSFTSRVGILVILGFALTVGDKVGLGDGAIDGVLLGFSDIEGGSVGCDVGCDDNVGLSLGLPVGLLDSEGAVVGDAVVGSAVVGCERQMRQYTCWVS